MVAQTSAQGGHGDGDGDGDGATERETDGELAGVTVTVAVALPDVLAVMVTATDALGDGDAATDALADAVGVGVQNDAHVGKSTRQLHVRGQPMKPQSPSHAPIGASARAPLASARRTTAPQT